MKTLTNLAAVFCLGLVLVACKAPAETPKTDACCESTTCTCNPCECEKLKADLAEARQKYESCDAELDRVGHLLGEATVKLQALENKPQPKLFCTNEDGTCVEAPKPRYWTGPPQVVVPRKAATGYWGRQAVYGRFGRFQGYRTVWVSYKRASNCAACR